VLFERQHVQFLVGTSLFSTSTGRGTSSPLALAQLA